MPWNETRVMDLKMQLITDMVRDGYGPTDATPCLPATRQQLSRSRKGTRASIAFLLPPPVREKGPEQGIAPPLPLAERSQSEQPAPLSRVCGRGVLFRLLARLMRRAPLSRWRERGRGRGKKTADDD